MVALIREEKYYAARARLQRLKHPKAKTLLERLDSLAPLPQQPPCTICANEGFQWHRARMPLPGSGLQSVAVEVDDTPLVARVCNRCGHVLFFMVAPPGVTVH